MPTTILDHETYQGALQRRYAEEAKVEERMTTKLEQAARQALEALEAGGNWYVRQQKAIAALRDALAEPKCWCETCRPITMDDMRMVLCPTCGNKRCPHATDHRNACTGSNKPGQKGSSYEHCKPAEQAEQEPVIGAYEVVNEKGDEWSLVYPAAVHRYKSIPEERITQTFYAAPVRTKDLTLE